MNTVRGGYFGQILRVNLSTEEWVVERSSEGFLLQYIGGRGFGAKLVWDNLKAHNFMVDPLGEENLLVIAPGPLTGLYLPSSGKCSFVSLSPATGIYGDSNMGGVFGVELRQTGYDAVAITGKAEELSFLFIDNGDVSIIAAPELRGKGCLEAEGLIKQRLGDHSVHVAVIGVAGENLVSFACVNADWSRNAGRTGIGAVMGAKNLKAIVVRGSKDLPVYDLERLNQETCKAMSYIKNHKFFKLWQEQGLMCVIDYANNMGILPTHNFRDGAFVRSEAINGFTMESKFKIGDSACFACPMACGNICLVKDGKYAGTVTEGPEYESCAMLGSNLGVDKFPAILKANSLCDELGMDTISVGSLIGAVIEGYETGLLSLEDLDGEPIQWGDDEKIIRVIENIARREGIGEILAGGARKVLNHWPQLTPLLSHVKGLEQSAYDCRAAISMALAYATCDIGAHHTRAWTVAKELEDGQNWSLEEKATFVVYHQTIRPLFDMLGVCRLPWIELGLNEKHYENFYAAATGVELSLDDLMARSREVYDLTRLISVKRGVSRDDDQAPVRWLKDPVQTGMQAGKTIREDDFNEILSTYYRLRNWDDEGKPLPEIEKRFD
ncbi:MAG: aldehyde ferredoxin oxidoreductase family protein [Deltaproteobacteria bacterium]|nr:aldehyde ferredoxin oxidoreductase family protein [Deltaproteobacteria bacterium]